MEIENQKIDIQSHFKMPIEFEHKINQVSDNVKNDFEFNTKENPYNIIFNKNNNKINSLLIEKWKTYFSSSKKYLVNLQKFILQYKKKCSNKHYNEDHTLFDTFFQHKYNDSFNEKYEYINWKHLEFANSNKSILQAMTYYNLFSPIINLSIPVFLLIMPFIIIKFILKTNISFENYKNILSKQIKNHSLGKIFSIFSREITTDKKIFAAISVAFYFFSIYQSILTCIKFYNNSFQIQEYLFNMKQQLLDSVDKINDLRTILSSIPYFKQFSDYLVERKQNIEHLLNQMSFIDSKTFNYKNIIKFGDYLALFYNLRNDNDMYDTICFSFNLQCYINNMDSLCDLIKNNRIHRCKYIKNNDKQIIKQQYYLYNTDNSVKNDVRINKHIITGPNASGKTTLLKTTLLNILFSQQFGFGFYDKAQIVPYNIIDSYINIPDTSGRDSLFQAEARRCLQILNNVKKNKKGYSFIIFDEIYSGTNPYEATTSANAFIECFEKYNVYFMITTHFKELTNIKNIKNYHMDCIINNETGNIKYNYKFKKGISTVRGGFIILKDLEYPTEIINKLK